MKLDKNKLAKTNLKRFDATTDEIDTSEIPPLGGEFFATAKWRKPKPNEKFRRDAIDLSTIEERRDESVRSLQEYLKGKNNPE